MAAPHYGHTEGWASSRGTAQHLLRVSRYTHVVRWGDLVTAGNVRLVSQTWGQGKEGWDGGGEREEGRGGGAEAGQSEIPFSDDRGCG